MLSEFACFAKDVLKVKRCLAFGSADDRFRRHPHNYRARSQPVFLALDLSIGSVCAKLVRNLVVWSRHGCRNAQKMEDSHRQSRDRSAPGLEYLRYYYEAPGDDSRDTGFERTRGTHYLQVLELAQVVCVMLSRCRNETAVRILVSLI